MAKLVYAYDLKSYPLGCWFDSSHKQLYVNKSNINSDNLKIKSQHKLYNLFLRKIKMFNKSRYARNRQLARVIFYFAIYINVIIIYGVFYVFYGLTFSDDLFSILVFLDLVIFGIFSYYK